MQKSIFITFSGLFGGMTKAISSGFVFCSINFPHIIEISVYAAISAAVGYLVKLGIDLLKTHIGKNSKRISR